MKYFIFLFFLLAGSTCFSQQSYWQQQVNYKMNVALNDADHTLDGFAKIEYINRSPDTLFFIWFHVWPNAFRTDKTAFSDQLLENGRTDFYFSDAEDRGYMNRLDFRVNSVAAKVEDHPQHIDIIKVVLPQPLAPNASIEITTPFHVKLPKNFSRGGHIGQSYQITQWYPKPAVYDKNGWHPMPYLDQGEFYSEFGNYEVQITLPKDYVVLSSGNLQNEEERKFLHAKADTYERDLKIWSKQKNTTVKKSTGNKVTKPTRENVELKTLIYEQNNIHDFAWFADKKYLLKYDTLKLPSGRVIEIYTAFSSKSGRIWDSSTRMVKDAVRFRSAVIGEYPYNTVTAVEAPMGFTGGMEYPCITAISGLSNEKSLESVIEHEVGHNWFQGMLANNEQRYPWLDEGVNSYYGKRFDAEYSRFKTDSTKKKAFQTDLDDGIFLLSFERWKLDQPLNTSSDSLSEANYTLVAYEKGAQFMQLLEQQLGRTEFDKAMQSYFEQWKGKHPYPNDLKNALEKSSGKNLDATFALLDRKGSLQPEPKKKLRISPLFGTNDATSNTIIVSPVFGANLYDGLMAGGALHNYSLAHVPFRFLIAPMYGTKSKELNGLARMSYTFYPNQSIFRLTFAITALKFSTNDFIDTANRKYILGVRKIAPSLKLVFNESNPRSTRERFIQWKTFFLEEDDLRFRSDTFPNGNRFLEISKFSSSRYLNQLRFVIQDTRALYPYRGELMAEQAKDFLRLAFTGKYHFNYNEKSGADIRVFAGKFIYLGDKTTTKQFTTDPYHLNLSTPKGSEDYTYSNYFAGRNEFEGFASQQVMMRDGGFKVRTDLLADKVGKTDDWLMAVNISSNIPDQVNILNILPIKIPLKVYLDLGTYAEAWGQNATGSKVLFNAGLQLSLLKNTVHIYAPLFYSKVYRDYFESTIPEKRFLKNISFSIDIQNFNFRKVDRRIPF